MQDDDGHDRPALRHPIRKRYTNGEVTVLWQPVLCRHTGVCFRGLPEVFDPRRRPWIVPEAASSDEIVAQVARCPTGALSIIANDEAVPPDEPT